MSTPRRADAARNRVRLLDAARAARERSGAVPSLADLAADAGLGVGTVYRHFPTHQALAQALAAERLRELLDDAREACASGREDALGWFLVRAVRLLAADPSTADVFAATTAGAGGDADVVAGEIVGLFSRLLDRDVAAGRVRADIGPADVHHLVCGIQLAVRLADGPPEVAAERYTRVLLAGLAG